MKLREFIDSYPIPPHSTVLYVSIDMRDGRSAYRLVLQPFNQIKQHRKANEEGIAGRPVYGAVTDATIELYPPPSTDGEIAVCFLPPAQVI